MTIQDVSRLISIPPELLLKITFHLPTPDYGKLRLTCKYIEATLFNSFSREFFTKRQFMFTEFSLQALIDISKSRLSPCLKHVIFGLERPSQPLTPGALPSNGSHHRLIQYNRSMQEFYDHAALLNTGQDVQMITKAFSYLENLEAVGMRDFYSRSRSRDFPYDEWRSYGVSTFEETTGRRLEMPRRHGSPDQAGYVNRIFLTLLRAIGKSTSHPKRFEAILRSSTFNDQTFNFPKFVQPIVRPVLAKLDGIFLELNFEFPPTYVHTNNVPVECPSYFLRKFVSNLIHLEHLRMNFFYQPSLTITDFFSWFGKSVPSITSTMITSASSLPETPPPISLSNLRQLDIGMLTIEPQYLLSIIEKYRTTLCTISFHKVALLEDPAVKPRERVNLWVALLENISKLNVNLTAINLSYISQAQEGGQRLFSVIFTDQNSSSKRWVGPDIQKGVKDIIGSVVVLGLDDESESSESDSDESMVDFDIIGGESDDDDDDDDDA